MATLKQKRLDPEYRRQESIKNNIRGRKYRTDLITMLGGKCVVCGFDNMMALQPDHINGDGKREFQIRRAAAYNYYLKNPDIAKKKLQVLCSNHNLIKKYINHEVHHSGGHKK